MTRFTLFLDDGGVINDNSVRAPQWQRLVGEYFVPILGGTHEAWAEANRRFTDGLFGSGAWQARLEAARDYADFERNYFLDWMRGMCAEMGIEPPSEEECVRLGREAGEWIIPRVRSDYPGAADAIRLLHSRGYTLHMASGASSADLEGYLGAVGVRQYFGKLYGGDLVGAFKAGPEFYRRIFEDSAVDPPNALVLEDNPLVITWISQAGARSLLVGDGDAPSVPGCLGTIKSLAELPALLASL